VIQIAGAALGMAALPGGASAAALRSWRGTALGADAGLSLYHPDRGESDRIIAACVAEIRRLESIFSLFDPTSDVSRLNSEGVIDEPPGELMSLLTESQRLGALTGGAFDVTVQPLW
jgi:thiamine biosynthesis lipoprotein